MSRGQASSPGHALVWEHALQLTACMGSVLSCRGQWLWGEGGKARALKTGRFLDFMGPAHTSSYGVLVSHVMQQMLLF